MTDDDIDRRLASDASAWNSSPKLPAVSLTATVARATAEPTAGADPPRGRPQRRRRRGAGRWSGVRVGHFGFAVEVLVLLAALLVPFALIHPGGGHNGGRGRSVVTGPVPATGTSSGVAPTGSAQTPAALACPDTYNASARTTIPDRDDRLVPQRAPLSAVVCAYRSTSGAELGLAVPISKNLADISQLSWFPRVLRGQSLPCGGVGFEGPYALLLLGVRYADGVVWVNGSANTTDCTGSGNGTFGSLANASGEIIGLARANGHIIPSPNLGPPIGQEDPCQAAGPVGRYGQEISMVPDGANRVTVCQVLTSANRNSYRHVTSTAVRDLALVLNSATTIPSDNATTCTGGSPTASYEARFDYPAGPAVLVRLEVGCTASVDNSSLQATNGAAAAAVAEQMLAGH